MPVNDARAPRTSLPYWGDGTLTESTSQAAPTQPALAALWSQHYAATRQSRRTDLETGLTDLEHVVLLVIARSAGSNLTRLARTLVAPLSTVRVIVGRLRKWGFIDAIREPGDRRRRSYGLSRVGRSLLSTPTGRRAERYLDV